MKIVLLGAPGSGKGTISKFLCEKHNLMHISTGDLFRAALQKDDDFAKEIKQFIVSGAYVPDRITNKIASDAIEIANQNFAGFILDGFPRTTNQAEFLKANYPIDKVLFFDVNTEILLKRISGRRMCPNCQTIYNVYFYNKPGENNTCTKCHVPVVQRKDDAADVAEARIKLYLEETAPLVDYYKQMGILGTINVDQEIDKILDEVDVFLKK